MGEGKGFLLISQEINSSSRLWYSSVGLVIYLFILKTLWVQVGGETLAISVTVTLLRVFL